jgi:G3E family GTPase
MLTPAQKLLHLDLKGDETRIRIRIPADGTYALFTEHKLDDLRGELRGPLGVLVKPVQTKEYREGHHHSDEVTSVGIAVPGDLDLKKFNKWLTDLLATKGPDIYRMKGILSIRGVPERYVFQGVHMIFDGKPDKPWGKNPRSNRLIFIGKNLDREELEGGFRACLA